TTTLPTAPYSSMLSIFCSNAPTTPYIYTLSLHDALPIYLEDAAEADLAVLKYQSQRGRLDDAIQTARQAQIHAKAYAEMIRLRLDRKSTRLNSSHVAISYAVFCLKKKRESNSATIKITTS